MSIYVGASNAKKEAAQLYLGRDGTKSEVTEAYALKDGTVSQVYANVAKPGQTIFTTSGNFKVPNGVTSVDVFLVGGGGAGGSYGADWSMAGSYWYTSAWYGSGGAGGYTTTAKNISVSPRMEISVLVGAGSANGKDATGTGGRSSAFGYYADGGGNCGGNGGSGGGQGAYEDSTNSPYQSNKYYRYGGNGGYDGNNGYLAAQSRNSTGDYLRPSGGQGTTTRAFGESSGTLYAGGGGGAGVPSSGYYTGGYANFRVVGGGGGEGANYSDQYHEEEAGHDGTGGGGGGGHDGSRSVNLWPNSENPSVVDPKPGMNGGSGCVIVRWGY